MKLSNDLNGKLASNDLNVKFTSNIHKDLNFEYSGSNALSVAWTKLLEVKNPIQTAKWEEELLDASLRLLSYPPRAVKSIPTRIDDISFVVYDPNACQFPCMGMDTPTQIHFAFELQEGVNHKKVIDFLKTIATKHFEVNHYVTKLSIAITKKNDKNIVVAMDTIHNRAELTFLVPTLAESSSFFYTHSILHRVLSRMIIAYISKESIRYIEESTTNSVYKRVGFVCNTDGSIQGSTLGDNEEGYAEWDIILPEQVVSQDYYQNKYGPNYQHGRNNMSYEERLESFKDPVQCPCKPAPVSVNQVVDYTTKLTMEYFRQEMLTDVNFYTKVSYFLTDIRNFASGKK